MWFRSLLDALLARPSRTPARPRRPALGVRRRPRGVRPILEILEDRTLLSTYTVNRLTDTGTGSGLAGDLRYCINQSNANNQANTIVFDSTVFSTRQTITLSGSQLELEDTGGTQTITGPATGVTISGGGKSCVVQVDSGVTASISGLTISGGSSSNGGGLANDGTATLTDCTLSDNGAFSDGGGLDNSGTANLIDCTLSGNSVGSPSWGGGGCGGGVFNAATAKLTLTGCTVSGNTAYYDSGGGVFNSGTVNLTDSTVSGNNAYDGGGVQNAGTANLSDCTVSGNNAYNSDGGGLDNSGTANLTDCTLSGNSAHNADSVYGDGGGVFNAPTGNLTLTECTVSGNSAHGSGGGVNNSGTAILADCTFSSNSISGYGGGVFNAPTGNLTLTECTVSGNISQRGGGGVCNSATANLTLTDCTLSGNAGYGGGLFTYGTTTLTGTIVAGNTGGDISGSYVSSDSTYNLIGTGGSGGLANGYNHNQVGVADPGLGALGDYGGPTQTIPLLPGSPAINAGDNTNALAYDQRGPGFPRIVGGTSDIGAFEVQVGTTTGVSELTVSGFPSTTTAGTAYNFTVTALNADGTTATGYTGTIHFTSTDVQASLPANYTFTAADAGMHTFSASLKTAGSQSLAATDTTRPSLLGRETGITVRPAAASTMSVAAYWSATTAGVADPVTVTLKDPYGNIASGYTGTVHFTSSDGKAVRPANYTFTATDAGVYTFSATLKTAGTQSITVTDTRTASLSGTDAGITVIPAAASQFIVTAPSSVTAGVAFSLTLTVEDAYGNVVTGYTGTVHFSSTDSSGALPSNYTFKASDKGVHTFTGLVLRKKGNQKITIVDTHNSSLTGDVMVDVL